MISYSHDDSDFIKTLDAKLQGGGVDSWLDSRDIRPGYPWREEIFKAIVNCEYVIVCLSPTYIQSQMCRMEVYLARCYGKKVLPIMISEECWNELQIHHELSGLDNLLIANFVNNKVFGFALSQEEQFQQIIDSIKPVDTICAPSSAYISFRAINATYATKIADDLADSGINTWIATRSYRIGDECLELQWKALMAAKVLIVVLSEAVLESHLIQNEILVAITRKLPVIPVLIDFDEDKTNEFTRRLSRKLVDSSSYEMRYLSEIHWLYPNNPDYPSMIEKLRLSIEALLAINAG